jgi:hypothetical protein
MPKKHIAILIAAALLTSSCSSTRKSIALGLAAGAGTGAAIGALTSPHGQGAMTGLAVGALVGGIASYFVDKGLQDRDQDVRRDTLFNLEKHGVFGKRYINPPSNPIFPLDNKLNIFFFHGG